MLEALLSMLLLVAASMAAAVVLVAGLVRTVSHLDSEAVPDADRPDARPTRRPRLFRPRREPEWWPEFERAFAEYVRAGAGQES